MTWPFVGRQEELGLIHQAMSDAATAGIVIAGAAGVGKTRLGLEALASADPQRYLTSRVTATQATSSIPFGALAQLLPAELPAAGDRVNVLGLAAKALIAPAGHRRLVLEVDDAHLLDDTSAALLYQLVRSGNTFVMALVRSWE
ncbi:MAG: ATP-binding protein [Egibacteraceae bacterium]